MKDLADILLIAELRQMDGPLLQQAMQATFDTRKTTRCLHSFRIRHPPGRHPFVGLPKRSAWGTEC